MSSLSTNNKPTLMMLTEAVCKKIVEGTRKTEFTSSASIYRVPEELRKLKESAYTPRLVSIGPLHCKDQHLLKSPAQNIKMSYVNSLLYRCTTGWGRSNDHKSMVLLMECLSQMRASIDEAKKCYAEDVDEFLDEEMLVIDGCFVLELLYRFEHEESKKSSDPIFGNVLTADYIRHDLILLENQLPFFVLQKLFDITVAFIPTSGSSLTLSDYVISFFGDILNSESNSNGGSTLKKCWKVDYLHILHILHYHYHPEAKPTHGGLNQSMPSASDLEYAGIEFVGKKPANGEELKVRFSESKGLSKLFNRPRFEIPTLFLYDSTEPFLRNLIAFEQCCPRHPVHNYFTSYADFMDTLISSSKDVQVLEKAGVIRNHLGAIEDASTLFNNLCKEIVLGECYFAETISAADAYSKRRWSDFMANLRRKYFATPWTVLAFCAGFITFGISAVKFISSTFHV